MGMTAIAASSPQNYVVFSGRSSGGFAGAFRKTEWKALRFDIRPTRREDTPRVLDLVDGEARKSGAIKDITEEELLQWIESGHSFVATIPDGERSDKIIGHLGANLLSRPGWIELRSGVVSEEYREHHVHSTMFADLIDRLLGEYPDPILVGSKHHIGRGRRIVEAFGFRKVPKLDVPPEVVGQAGDWDVYIASRADLQASKSARNLLKNVRRDIRSVS